MPRVTNRSQLLLRDNGLRRKFQTKFRTPVGWSHLGFSTSEWSVQHEWNIFKSVRKGWLAYPRRSLNAQEPGFEQTFLGLSRLTLPHKELSLLTTVKQRTYTCLARKQTAQIIMNMKYVTSAVCNKALNYQLRGGSPLELICSRATQRHMSR
jgi:hypothetical protein